MSPRCLSICIFVVLAISFATAADTAASTPKLTAAEIVERSVSARGGLRAWRAVNALSISGKMEAGGNSRPTLPVPGRRSSAQMPPPRPADQVQLPFVMELKRPRKMRLELQFNGQTAVQVFDGTSGWKLRPFLNRREVEPYTAEELKAAASQSDLDGPLVDYALKGTTIVLEKMEKVENKDTYKLKVTLKNGQVQHVWVDAQTFLETKTEGAPRRMDGRYHPVLTYFRDYKPEGGLMMPHTVETVVEEYKQKETIKIEKIAINPQLDESRFAKLQ